MGIVVFARRYRTEAAARKQATDFDRWCDRVEIDRSRYLTRMEPDGDWVIVVIEAGDGRSLTEFRWQGEPYELAEEQARAMLDRAAAAGSERIHIRYGKAAPLRLTPEGNWELPTPGRG
jgi:hypothetical protein